MMNLEEFMNVFQLRQAGYSISTISRMTGRDRKTIRKYLDRGKEKPPQMNPRQARDSILKPFEAYMLTLKTPEDEFPPCTAIYEKLVEKGYTGSLSLVQKRIKKYRNSLPKNIIVRFETPPGKQAQIDWGEKRKVDKATGRAKTVYIFCMTLSWSRARFVYFTPKADRYYFLLGHQLAFDYFGGIPEEILYDQNRCVLLRPGIKDVAYNSRFLDFAHHYGFMPKVCRPYRPQTKGKVENSVKYVKRNFLMIQDTNDCDVLNQRRLKWLNKINTKVHATIQEIPFKRLPNENLRSISEIPDYPLFYMETRKVFGDSTFSFHSQRFSVPPDYIGKRVTIKHRPNQSRIDVFYKDRQITQHRTDTAEKYIIKRVHRHKIWSIWREDKKLFYAKPKSIENHPLKIYEEIGNLEVSHESANS